MREVMALYPNLQRLYLQDIDSMAAEDMYAVFARRKFLVFAIEYARDEFFTCIVSATTTAWKRDDLAAIGQLAELAGLKAA